MKEEPRKTVPRGAGSHTNAPTARPTPAVPSTNRLQANARHIITMSCAGILIAIIALAALTLAPKPSLAQSLTQQAERPGSGRASADTAAASRGRPDELAPRFRPVVKKPHNYEPPKAAKPAKPSRPAKPAKPYKPGKHEEPDWCHPEAYCDTDEECHAMYPCKYTKCETSRRYTDKTWPKQGKCVCEGKVPSKLFSRHAD